MGFVSSTIAAPIGACAVAQAARCCENFQSRPKGGDAGALARRRQKKKWVCGELPRVPAIVSRRPRAEWTFSIYPRLRRRAGRSKHARALALLSRVRSPDPTVPSSVGTRQGDGMTEQAAPSAFGKVRSGFPPNARANLAPPAIFLARPRPVSHLGQDPNAPRMKRNGGSIAQPPEGADRFILKWGKSGAWGEKGRG